MFVDLQENMIAKIMPRRKRSSSTHNLVEGQKFQFLPIPMAVREMQIGSVTFGPATTLPNVNVPTTKLILK